MCRVIAGYGVHQSEWFVNLINVVQYRYYVLNNLSLFLIMFPLVDF